jgi:hypothetical protein
VGRARATRSTIAILALGVALLLSACVQPISPARTFDAFEHKAKNTAEAVISSVETARLAARVAGNGDAFGPFVSVTLSEAEKGAAHAGDVFASVQPPDERSDRLRAQLISLLTRANETLSSLRIAARRGELEQLPLLARPLRKLSRQLDHFVMVHE